jgi:RNA polymerase sigma-70 factor (ECF subfamily)
MFSHRKKDRWSGGVFESFKAGDEIAFSRIFERYHRSLYIYISRLVNDSSEAEDIVTEAFVRLYSHRSRIQDDDHLIKFLFTVARNNAVEYFRRIEKRRKLASEIQRMAETLHIEPMEYEYTYMRLLEEIHHTIEHLPPTRKEIFHLRYYFEKDVRFIARKMNIAEQTVRNQLNRVMVALRRELKVSDE